MKTVTVNLSLAPFRTAILRYIKHMTITATHTAITMSESAARQINAIMAKQDQARMLRVAVDGGGCSGFSYRFEFADTQNEDDLLVERDGAKIVIDEMSLEFLEGSEIDYSRELIGAAFKVNNPNATANCGCGTSFSI
jgi:iron-sulfur cluster assembly protein